MKPSRIISVLAACLFLFSSCHNSEGILLFWGNTDTRYEQCEKPVDLSETAFRYPVWKGERAFAQAVLWTERDLSGVCLRSTDLYCGGKVIPSERIKTDFVSHVMADVLEERYSQCGQRPAGQFDSLMVADIVDEAEKRDIAGGFCQPIWMTVDMPDDAKPGTYKGNLIVKGKDFGKIILPYEITVPDRVLPKPSEWKFHLDLWQNPYSVARYHDVKLWSDEHFEYMRPVMKLLADAGQKVITATIMDRPWNGQTEDAYGSMVRKTLKSDGSWEYGYEDFDRWVEFMMSLGIDDYISCYSLIPWKLEFDYFDEASGEVVRFNASPVSEEYRNYWIRFLSDFAVHLREKGWFEKTMIAMDERPEDAMKAAFDVIRIADPDFKVSLAGNWHPEIESELHDYCVTLKQTIPADIIEKRRQEGKVSTYYTCCAEKFPNTFVVSPLSEAVWIPWKALAGNLDGYLRWAYNHWTADPLEDARFRTWPAGDCFSVYPEGRSSLRHDKLMEGIQDYEKARILIDEWRATGDTVKLKALDEALSLFTVEKLAADGASAAIHKAKQCIQ